MSDFLDNNTDNLSTLTINGEVNDNSEGKTSEEIQEEKDAANEPIKQKEAAEKSVSFLQKLTALENGKAFDPANYLDAKLTNEDIFPTLNKPIKVGEYQGKTIGGVSLFATNAVMPYGALNKRKEAIQASIAATQAKNAKIKSLLDNTYYPTSAQFNQEFNDRVFLKNQEWLKKYNYDYTALSKDPQFVKQQNDFEEQSKALKDVHDYVFDIVTKHKKGETVSPDKLEIANQYISGTGRFDAEGYVNDIINGKQKPSDLRATIQRTETMEAFLKKGNLDLFVKKMPVEYASKQGNRFYKISGGVGYSKSLMESGTHEYLDKESMLEGLKGYVKEHRIEGTGDFNAPQDSPEYKKWQEFSEHIFNTAKTYKDIITPKLDVFDNGQAQKFSNDLALRKYNDDKVTYYRNVLDLVTKPDEMEKIRTTADGKQREKAYADYMRRFPTTNKFGVNNAIDLGAPVNKDGFWNTNNIAKSFTYKVGGVEKSILLTPQQIIQQANNPKGNAYGITAEHKKSAEFILKQGSGKFEKTAEFAFHMVKDGSSEGKGRLIPLEKSTGNGIHSKIYTTVGSHGHIIYQKQTEKEGADGKYSTYQDIKGFNDWVVLNPIDEAHQRANLESKATAKEVEAEKEY